MVAIILPGRNGPMIGGGTSGGGGWTPASLGAALIGWYIADTGVYHDAGSTLATNGQTVLQWNDQSGNNKHLVTGGSPPTYSTTGFNSQKTISFNSASAQYLENTSFPMGTGTTGSAFAAASINSGSGSYGRLISYIAGGQAQDYDNTGSASLILRRVSNQEIGMYRNSNQCLQNITYDAPSRLGGIFDGSNQISYVNNVAGSGSAQTNAWGTSPGTLRVGMAGGAAFKGNISEIIVTNSALSSGDRSSLDSYLTAKWGI